MEHRLSTERGQSQDCRAEATHVTSTLRAWTRPDKSAGLIKSGREHADQTFAPQALARRRSALERHVFPLSVANRVDLLGDCRRALELQVEFKCFRVCECLPAMRALVRAVQLDPNVLETSIARHGFCTDLHLFW